jgi:GTP-binding protein Era
MVQITRDTPKGIDVALLLVDASKGVGPGDREAAKMLKEAGTPTILLLNKIDLIRPKSRLLPMIAAAVEDLGFDEVVPISAKSGDGCEQLVELVVERLPEGPPDYDDDFLTDQSQRTLAAEWIREKLLALTRQELPHATAVMVESWKERDDGLIEVHATIVVDRDSQKKIVIGRQGSLLKQVGTQARLELEAFLDQRIHLALWVRVRKDWRDDNTILQSLELL